MKYIATFLMFVFFGIIVAWVARNFTVVETNTGGEWMLLRGVQTAECEAGNGCAVYSVREIQNLLIHALQKWQAERGTGV